MKLVLALGLALLAGGARAAAPTFRPTLAPTSFPTRTPSTHPSAGPTASPSTSVPSKAPVSSVPTPAPLWWPYERCCAQTFNMQPKQCFQQTWSQCYAYLTQLIGRRQLADGSFAEPSGPVEVPEHLRRLEAAGSQPCTYFFTTLNQLTSYVKKDEGLKNGNMTRRIKGLFKGQGGIWCKTAAKYKGDCGCHSQGGYCAYKSRFNCQGRMERIQSFGGTPQHMCYWINNTPDPLAPDGFTVPAGCTPNPLSANPCFPALLYPDDGYCLNIPRDPAETPPDPNQRPLPINWPVNTPNGVPGPGR